LIAFFIAIVNANKDNLYKELVKDEISLKFFFFISLINNLKIDDIYVQIIEIIVVAIFQY